MGRVFFEKGSFEGKWSMAGSAAPRKPRMVQGDAEKETRSGEEAEELRQHLQQFDDIRVRLFSFFEVSQRG